jgi:prefoldin subunit 5
MSLILDQDLETLKKRRTDLAQQLQQTLKEIEELEKKCDAIAQRRAGSS